MTINENIESVMSQYSVISLDELGKASLMRRKDNKYVFGVAGLASILFSVKDSYLVLDIDGIRSHNYQTIYYDTPEKDMYHMHHRGKANRYKVRVRRYSTSGVQFLEVKKKDSRGVTAKNRIRTDENESALLTPGKDFLASLIPYSPDSITPVLENSFNRITLVAHDRKERITLDYQLRFSDPGSGKSLELPGLSIAEIKFSERLHESVFHRVLHNHRILPSRFSKYCIGTAMLDPLVKQNRFKEKVRKVQKINHAFIQTNHQ
jgi:hypothetical protein